MKTVILCLDAGFEAEINTIENKMTDQNINTQVICAEEQMQRCTGCGKCWKPRKCIYDDSVNKASASIKESDGVIFLANTVYGKLSTHAETFLERLFCSANETMAGKVLLPILKTRKSGTKDAAMRMMEFFLETKAIVITSETFWKETDENTLNLFISTIQKESPQREIPVEHILHYIRG